MAEQHQEVNNIPRHIAIIMDGNGRWAKKKGAARIFGHRSAITAVRDSVEFCAEHQVGFLTLYAFSTENWSRPQEEVQGLMSLLVSTIKDELPTLQKNNIKLSSIGDISLLPEKTRKTLAKAKELTATNTGLTLVLALNYSGRWDMEQAIKKIGDSVEKGKLSANLIDENVISTYMDTHGMPDPELLIRTSGEMRVSNFLLWQIAYTELFFTEVLWPDFRKKHLEEALTSYQKRERRFGKTSEQVKI
ncbi:MAG: isoprenyl transferase [Cyclobacteriaceae bacterium]